MVTRKTVFFSLLNNLLYQNCQGLTRYGLRGILFQVMKKAVITTGGKQYIVSKGDVIDIELIKEKDTVSFKPLLIYGDGEPKIGQPVIEGAKVTAKILEDEVKGDKVTAIRFKAKKRVHKTKGHRQKFTRIEITSITAK